MKAFDLIEDLVADGGIPEGVGTMSIVGNDDVAEELKKAFGKYDIIYDPHGFESLNMMSSGTLKVVRHFVYINNDRLCSDYDKDIFAILKVYDDDGHFNFLSTFYEVE